MALIGAQVTMMVYGYLWGRPTADYRATYVDHSMDCWLPEPPEAVLARDIGEAERIVPKTLTGTAACALLPQGWNPADAWGVWSAGPIARILVPFRAGDRRATLHVVGYAPHRTQHVLVSQTGEPDRRIAIPPGAVVAVDVERRSPLPIVAIRLQIADVHNPLDTDVADWRCIGVALLDVVRSSGDPSSAPPR